jgi:putative DNA primase/helicase
MSNLSNCNKFIDTLNEENKNCEKNATVKLWKIKKYSYMKKENIEKDGIIYDVCDAEKLIKNDRGYHIRLLDDNTLYPLFFDIEKNCDFEQFKKDFSYFFEKFHDMKINDEDYKYTENEGSKDKKHVVIKIFHGNLQLIKNLVNSFLVKYKKYNNGQVDTSVYKNGWFRLPNQSKEGKENTCHRIVKGSLEDFLMWYIPYYSYCINNFYKKNQKKEIFNKLSEEKKIVDDDSDNDDNSSVDDDVIVVDKDEIDSRLKNYYDIVEIKNWEDRKDWFELICTMKNQGCSKELAKFYSKKASNYSEKEFDKLWKSINKNREKKVGYKKMIEILNSISTEKTIECQNNDITYIFKYKILKDGITDNTASRLFKNISKTDFVYDPKNDKWYYLNNFGIYREDFKRNILEKTIVDTLLLGIENLYKKSGKTHSTKEDELYIESKLFVQSTKHIKSIAEYLKNLYLDEKIFDLLNSKNHLIGFNNGIYDLKEDKFRKGIKEDYVLFTTKYNYNKPKDKDTNNFMKYIDNIFLKEDIKEYWLKILSTCLTGDSIEEAIYVWLGSGGNGKGFLGLLSNITFGDYFKTIPLDYFASSNKRDPNQADNIMAQMKGIRILMASESDKEVKLDESKLKSITGGDIIKARCNYGSPFEFIPNFKLFLQTNNEPVLDGRDGGIKRRLRLNKFKAKFTSNEEDKDEGETKKDIDVNIKNVMKDNIELYGNIFFNILLTHFKKIDTNKEFILPKEIKDESNDFLNENDIFSSFFFQSLEKTDSEFDEIKGSLLYKEFCENYDNKKIKHTIKDFYKALIRYGFKLKEYHHQKIIQKIKFKNDEDDENKNELDHKKNQFL